MNELRGQTGSTWIALVVFEYQNDANSVAMSPNTTGLNPLNGRPWSTSSTLDDIREGARRARALSLQIMLKPHVDLYSGEWRAAIRPDDAGTWFSAYRSMMLKYAALAQELKIEMLCVGTEYVTSTQAKYTLQWQSLIASVRSVYRGRLVYAANWSGAYDYGLNEPEFTQVGFWSSLDYIGVDSYFALTVFPGDTIPPFDEAVAHMWEMGSAIGTVSYLRHKPVIFTETGIQSVKGALASPWNYSLGSSPSAVPDTNVQDFYYRVMIQAMGSRSWCEGLFWWNWESMPTSNAATNYTPRYKPAAATLRRWYTAGAI